MAREMNRSTTEPVAPESAPAKLRSSAVTHLKIAAAQLPEIAEAQARYGVALVLAGEQNLGRQFLQTALRLGSLDCPVPALGRVDDPPGRLSRGGRADRHRADAAGRRRKRSARAGRRPLSC